MGDVVHCNDSDGAWQCQDGGEIPGTQMAAFRLETNRRQPLPVLVSVPHAGRAYPEGLLSRMRDPVWCALRLEDRLIDKVADLVARETGAGLLVAHAPRAMIDLNRAPDDVDWEMVEGSPLRTRRGQPSRRSRSGLGLVPRRLSGLGEIWNGRIGHDELQARIAGIHRPYHQTLGLALETLRDRWGAALLIDLHSMPPLKARFPDEPIPEFVVGDRFGASSDAALSDRATAFLASHRRVSTRNRPYAGGYILERHAQPARGIQCLQLEVCRSAYLDANLQEPTARLAGLARLIAGLVRDLAGHIVADNRDRGFPVAAE